MLRRRSEGWVFGALAVCLTPWLLLAGACGALRCVVARESFAPFRRVWRATWRRWYRMTASGMDPLRYVWWGEFECEKATVIWRYVVFIELFNLLNVARGTLPAPNAPGKILVVKLAHFGDALHVVPFLRMLRGQRNDTKIDLMIGPWCKALATWIPAMDETIFYSPRHVSFNRGDRTACRGFWSELSFLFSLRCRHYDVLVSSSTTALAELCLIFALCPRRWVGADADMYLYDSLSESATVPYETRRYEAERVASLLPLLGCTPGAVNLEYPVSDRSRTSVRRLLATRGIRQEDRVVLICPGAGWPGKQWLPERFAALADIIVSEFGARIVIVGSAAERGLADKVAKLMTLPSMVLAGDTTLDELAALLELCELFIGNDSGPMHIAAALNVPTLVFFGPTQPAQWAPRGPLHVFMQSEARCEGCWYWHPRATCVHENRCMKAIAVEDAARVLRNLLSMVRRSRHEGRATHHEVA